ncbi:family A G protein-coupled receptor-like protein [Cryphonectria parasitica EP155]|uniref:Family A G protein-coupled receptor-like protein n=1 Tax=Cryphonectria parasitica (strain ATCC 38755 / EP155) TaxID=660469 RepID=A0A9P4Y4J5_CRYP1|nr:family A G protein-coupled receptor-like protein [Cryphonectria parasitica EP155]KAF3766242.1 family A G protein-coupled receptor-like protein [Cryphonectria parasitica EP155]
MFLQARVNDALNHNPPSGSEHLNVHGSDWLWAVTAVFALQFVVFFVLSAIHKGEKIFHYIFTITLLVGSIAYYAMASDLAWDVIGQVDHAGNGDRQIFFAKYVYWSVSFPAVNIALGLISGVSWATIAYTVFLSWTWVLAYLFTAYTDSTYKWGFYAFGTIAYLLLAYETLFESRRSLAGRDLGAVRTHHLGLASWVNLLWLNYPIAFGISDGGNVIGVVGSFIYFGILDVLLVPVVAGAFLFLARRWDYGRMNIAFTQYGRVRAAPGTFPEKNNNGDAAAAATPAGGPVNDVPAV